MRFRWLAAFFCLGLAACARAPVVTLRYTHPNASGSIAGMQAQFFARKAAEYTDGAVRVEVYPDSGVGSLRDQVSLVASGVSAINHSTAAAMGLLYKDFAVLDTPYLYDSVHHLLRVVAPESPVMKRLSAGLLESSGLRVLYVFYFGTRELSCDRPILSPADLAGLKVRSIPFPVYETAVEGLGAQAIPLDWSETPAALVTRAVNGQENPVNTILSAGLYKTQGYLMLTGHILGAEIVVINDAAWRKLSREAQRGLMRAAAETSAYATRLTSESEGADIEALRARGMKVIGPAEGLDRQAFAARTKRLVRTRYGAEWSEYYKLIDSLR
jgi:tripartite ATP-independent transporter DctP family solute receptor